MKIIQLLILFIMISCNGSESGRPSEAKSDIPNDTEATEQIFSYYVQIEGDAGDSITSLLIMSFGEIEEVQYPIVVSLVGGSDGLPFFGKNLYWNVKNNGSTPITVKIFKENVEVISQELAVNEVTIIRDNL